MSRTIFLSAGINQWYNRGAKRLSDSLTQHGWQYDRQIWIDEWPPVPMERRPVYNIKAAAVEYAMKQGYTTIIWGDASITARGNMDAFVAKVQADGYWIGQSGYNAAQTASDAQLQYFGVSRDWAANVPDCATGLFGICVENPTMRSFAEQWVQAGRDGAFGGSRMHANQSKDPRYLHCRQDQSAASLLLGKLGVPLRLWQDAVTFKWDLNKGQPFHCEGM